MHIPTIWKPLAVAAGLAALGACTPEPDAFKQADKNGNGTLCQTEFSLAMLNAVFAAGDHDGDARITWAEWQKVDVKADERMFRQRDVSGDGAISTVELKEFAARKKSFDRLFARIDANADGALQKAEVKEFHGKVMQAEGNTEMEKLINYTRQ